MLRQSIMLAATPGLTSIARPRPVAAHVERGCAIAQAVVAIACNGRPGSTAERRQARAAAFDRQIAMYLAHVGFGFSMAEVGKAFGRDRTTVVHACHLIEDRRDDCRFDVMLDHLEQAAIALRAADHVRHG
jgi:hypothetical protein